MLWPPTCPSPWPALPGSECSGTKSIIPRWLSPTNASKAPLLFDPAWVHTSWLCQCSARSIDCWVKQMQQSGSATSLDLVAYAREICSWGGNYFQPKLCACFEHESSYQQSVTFPVSIRKLIFSSSTSKRRNIYIYIYILNIYFFTPQRSRWVKQHYKLEETWVNLILSDGKKESKEHTRPWKDNK